MRPLFLGIDVGSSSVKTAVYDAAAGRTIGQSTEPANEQPISAPHPGWAEQDPAMWWHNFLVGYHKAITAADIDPKDISGIGISYQMHGLVAVDVQQHVLRPSIIWCDSRAVNIGAEATRALGETACLQTLLNAPGNFTASKLAWVKQHEPDVYARIHRIMLPGDYIAMRLSGDVTTTATGLSEGTLWDFRNRSLAGLLREHFDFDLNLFPAVVPMLGEQVSVKAQIASELGLKPGTPITYRAGDQPNNAFSLNVLHPGEVAATAGTSGVLYAVTDQDTYDPASRINTFLHVNDRPDLKRNGVLVCLNGTGILYRWLRQVLGSEAPLSYSAMNRMAETVDLGADGIQFYPFGNGAERILNNRLVRAHVHGLDFNRHGVAHLIRAGLEGIVFGLRLGFDILHDMSIRPEVIRAGTANLFLSPAFRTIFANVTGCSIERYNTDGAEGAARGAALGAGYYATPTEAFASLARHGTTEPDPSLSTRYAELYQGWQQQLHLHLTS